MLHCHLPRPLLWPSRLEENKDRRGVANCGLYLELVSFLCDAYSGTQKKIKQMKKMKEDKDKTDGADKRLNTPLINMKILRQIRCKACSRRRTPDRFHVQVITMALFHGKVFEVERSGTKPRAWTTRRIRWWFSTKTVSKEHRWRLHGSQRGRVFHGCRDRTGQDRTGQAGCSFAEREVGWL